MKSISTPATNDLQELDERELESVQGGLTIKLPVDDWWKHLHPLPVPQPPFPRPLPDPPWWKPLPLPRPTPFPPIVVF